MVGEEQVVRVNDLHALQPARCTSMTSASRSVAALRRDGLRLGTWAVVGLLPAPPILRRMTRRESGSAVEARREAAMKRYA